MTRTTDDQISEWRNRKPREMWLYFNIKDAIIDALISERDRADKAEQQLVHERNNHAVHRYSAYHHREAAQQAESYFQEWSNAMARLDAVLAFAEEMRGYCSPNGVAVMYADRLVAVVEGEVGA